MIQGTIYLVRTCGAPPSKVKGAEVRKSINLRVLVGACDWLSASPAIVVAIVTIASVVVVKPAGNTVLSGDVATGGAMVAVADGGIPIIRVVVVIVPVLTTMVVVVTGSARSVVVTTVVSSVVVVNSVLVMDVLVSLPVEVSVVTPVALTLVQGVAWLSTTQRSAPADRA